MPDADFIEGELLTWQSRTHPDSTTLTNRPVSFMGWKNHQAIVSFGLKSDGTGMPNVFLVPPSELMRLVPQHALKPQPPPGPAPAPVPLEERREALSLAYTAYCEAERAVFAAQELLDHALTKVEDAQRHLRQFADLEQHAADAVVHEIKQLSNGGVGHTIYDAHDEWSARDRAQRECAAAQRAYDQLARELSDTRAIMSDREQILHRAASFVVAGVVDRAVQKLAELEMQTAELRTTLKAASYLWFAGATIPIDPAAAKVLTEPPTEVNEGVGERLENNQIRQRWFEDLFTKLVSGDIDAELSWYSNDE